MIQESNFYGTIAADSLANTVIGGPNLQDVQYRFRLKTSLSVNILRLFFITPETTTKPGYAAGTGGIIQIDLATLNGLVQIQRWTLVLDDPQSDACLGTWAVLNFNQAVMLQAGIEYTITMTNISTKKDQSFSSIDSLAVSTPEGESQVALDRADASVWLRFNGGEWQERLSYEPIFSVEGPNGSDGIGYMEIEPSSVALYSREVITASQAFTSEVLWVRAITPMSLALTVTLTQKGVVVLSTTVAAVDAVGWAKIYLPAPLAVSVGDGLVLTIKGPMLPIRKGTQQGYAPGSTFADGHGEYSQDGQSWAALAMPTDLQFDFQIDM